MTSMILDQFGLLVQSGDIDNNIGILCIVFSFVRQYDLPCAYFNANFCTKEYSSISEI